MSYKERWDLQIALKKVANMKVDNFQTKCEENNITCWEMDHMIYDLAQALVRSKPNMENPREIKRMNYLSFFKDGVADGLFIGKQDESKLFSAYYKQGYDYGIVLWNRQVQIEDNEWERKNGR